MHLLSQSLSDSSLGIFAIQEVISESPRIEESFPSIAECGSLCAAEVFLEAARRVDDLRVSKAVAVEWGSIADISGMWWTLAIKIDDMMKESVGIYEAIRQSLFGFCRNPKEARDTIVYVCRDICDNVQAIALYDKKERELVALASNPINRFRGAGKAIMQQLVNQAFREGSILKVYPTHSAAGYYREKFHFEAIASASGYLGLTSVKIKALKDSGTFLF